MLCTALSSYNILATSNRCCAQQSCISRHWLLLYDGTVYSEVSYIHRCSAVVLFPDDVCS